LAPWEPRVHPAPRAVQAPQRRTANQAKREWLDPKVLPVDQDEKDPLDPKAQMAKSTSSLDRLDHLELLASVAPKDPKDPKATTDNPEPLALLAHQENLVHLERMAKKEQQEARVLQDQLDRRAAATTARRPACLLAIRRSLD